MSTTNKTSRGKRHGHHVEQFRFSSCLYRHLQQSVRSCLGVSCTQYSRLVNKCCLGTNMHVALNHQEINPCGRTLLPGSTRFVATKGDSSVMPPVRAWNNLSRVRGRKSSARRLKFAESVPLVLTPRFRYYNSWDHVRSPQRRQITHTTKKVCACRRSHSEPISQRST